MVWRSVRSAGDNKTRKSPADLALAQRWVDALMFQRDYQDRQRSAAGPKWRESGLVFASAVGTVRNAPSITASAWPLNNVLRSFGATVKRAGLNEAEWTPREMHHSFVSLLSDSGVPIEHIARLVGHTGGSDVTETVYRHQIRPVLMHGAEVMDRIFKDSGDA
jgi:integrase